MVQAHLQKAKGRFAKAKDKLDQLEGRVPMGSGPEVLAGFLASPAYGATSLHVRQTRELAKRNASKVVLASNLIDTVSTGEDARPTVRLIRVSWFGPTGEISFVAIEGGSFKAAMEQSVRTAGALRLPLHLFSLTGSNGNSRRTQHLNSLFVPRQAPPIGKLASEAQVLDGPDRFYVAISQISRAGLVGRKVLRREDAVERFQVHQDNQMLRIQHALRGESTEVTIARSDFVGIVANTSPPLAIALSESIELPSLDEWSRVDHRGRDLARWAYERLNIRWGV